MKKVREDIMDHRQGADISMDEQPEWLQKRLDWFMDLRFGLLIHWGPCSQWDCCESWPLVPADKWARPDGLKCWRERGMDFARFTQDYKNLNRSFNPVAFAPDEWAELARVAGIRYAAFITKHHDGFCMFDTATTNYRITHPDCPFHNNPRANVTREVFEAFRRKAIAISCYFSKSDWNSPCYWSPDFPIVDRNPNYDPLKNPELWSRFVDFTHRQVEELMTQYGQIDVLWLDGGQVRPPKQDIQMRKLAAMARARQPGLIIADRTVGGAYENFMTPEQVIPDQPLGVPWESCITLGKSWKYIPDDRYKPFRELVRILVETVAKGGNLLLGIGPDARGMIPREAAKRLREIGEWLRVNGDAIYGTRPIAPYQSGGIRFTSKNAYVYAIVLGEDDENAAREQIVVAGFRPAAGTEVALLGTAGSLSWRKADKGFIIDLPKAITIDKRDFVLRFVPAQ